MMIIRHGSYSLSVGIDSHPLKTILFADMQ